MRRCINRVSEINYTFPNSTGTPLNDELVIKSRQKEAGLIIHPKGGDDFSRTEMSCQNMSSLATILQKKIYINVLIQVSIVTAGIAVSK